MSDWVGTIAVIVFTIVFGIFTIREGKFNCNRDAKQLQLLERIANSLERISKNFK